MARIKNIFISIILLSLLSGCGIYSFTGTSIAPDIKTVNIVYFQNNAPLIQPRLSQVFTEAMKDRFVSQTNLNLVTKSGDLTFEGAITDYRIQPMAIQGNDQAALNRLTITVNVKFTNIKNEKQNFETSFSRYTDYSSSLNLASIEEGLIKDVTSQLVGDIFNKALVNW